MSGSDANTAHGPLALAKLRSDIDTLSVQIAGMRPVLIAARRGERQRKLFFLVALLLIAGLVVNTWLYIGVVMARSDARTYYNRQIRQATCLSIEYTPSSASPAIRDVRDQYRCPAAKRPPNVPPRNSP